MSSIWAIFISLLAVIGGDRAGSVVSWQGGSPRGEGLLTRTSGVVCLDDETPARQRQLTAARDNFTLLIKDF
jgi:hypothetical protein